MSWLDTRLLGEVFVTLFVIMDPPGTIPLFLSLTSGRSARARRRVALQASGVSLVVIVLFALFGRQIVDYLGISLFSLQLAGGLLLLLVALELLTGKADEAPTGSSPNVALVPLGTPLLAGPGAIVATMVFADRVDGWGDAASIVLAILAVHAVLWLTMRYSVHIIRVIRESGVQLISRIAGLLLSAIAVQLVVDAVRGFLDGG